MIYLAWQVYSVARCVAVKLFDRGPVGDETIGTDHPETSLLPCGSQENHPDAQCANMRAPDAGTSRSPATDNLLALQEDARVTSVIVAVADGSASPAAKNIQGTSVAPENNRRSLPAPEYTRRTLPVPENTRHTMPVPENNRRTLPVPENNRRILPVPRITRGDNPSQENTESTDMSATPSVSTGTLPLSPALSAVDDEQEYCLRSSIASKQSLLNAYLDAFDGTSWNDSPPDHLHATGKTKNDPSLVAAEGQTTDDATGSGSHIGRSEGSQQVAPEKTPRTSSAEENTRATMPATENTRCVSPVPENNRRILPVPENNRRTLPVPENNRHTLPAPGITRGDNPSQENTEPTDMTASSSVSTGTLPPSPALSEQEQCLRSSIASTQSLLNAYLDAFDGCCWNDSTPVHLQATCNTNDDPIRATAEGLAKEDATLSNSDLSPRRSQQVAETDLKECIYMMERLTSTHQAVQRQVDMADRGREKRRLLRIETKLKKSVQLMQRLVEAHLGLLRSAPNRTDWERDLYARARRWSIKVMQQLIQSHIMTLNESRARLLSAPHSHKSTKAGGSDTRSRERQRQFGVVQLTESTQDVKPAALDEIGRVSHETFTIEGPDAEPCPPVTLEWWWDPTATSHESHSNSSRCSQTDQSVTSNDSSPRWTDQELQQCTTYDPSVPSRARTHIEKYASTCSTDCRQRDGLRHADQDLARCCRSLPQVLEARLQILFSPQRNLQKATFVPQSARTVCGGDISIAVKTFDSLEPASGGALMTSGSALEGNGALSQRTPQLQQAWDSAPARHADDCLHITELSDAASQTPQTSEPLLHTDQNNTEPRLLSSDQSIRKRMRSSPALRCGRRFKTKSYSRQRRVWRELRRQPTNLVASPDVEYEMESRWFAPKSTVPPLPALPSVDWAPLEQMRPIAIATPDWNQHEQQLQYVTMETPDCNQHEQLQYVTMATPDWNQHEQLRYVTMATPDCNSHEQFQHVMMSKTDWTPHEWLPSDHMTARPDEVDCATCRQTSQLVTTPEQQPAPRMTSGDEVPPKPLTRDTFTDERPIFISLSR